MKTLLQALCAAALLATAAAQAQVKLEKPKLSIATTNPVISYYPFEIALAKGYFKDEGLEVERSIFAGGSQTTKALVGGSTDMIVSAYSNTLTMASKGLNLQAFVLMIKYPGFVLGVAKKAMAKYKTPQDLSGMVVGVTAPGSSTNFILNSFAKRNGVNPKSYSVIGVGAQATAAAAVREGQIDALVGLDPVVTMLMDSGDIRIVADLRTGVGTQAAVGADTYPEGSVIATAEFVRKNPQTVQAVVNAMLRAEKFLASATAEQIADALPKSYQVGERAQYLSAIEHTRTVYSTDGRYDPKGTEAVLAVLAGSDPEIAEVQKKIDIPATYTNKFVDAAVVKKP
jgi:NitT/TauT family transport system substrate-binding protein